VVDKASPKSSPKERTLIAISYFKPSLKEKTLNCKSDILEPSPLERAG